MMKPITLVMLLCLSASVAFTQEAAKKDTSNPAQSAFGGTLGDKATIKYKGEGSLSTDENGNAMASFRGGVQIEGDLLNLKCDDLVVDQSKQIMIAKGGVDFVRKEGAQKIAGSCGKLTMYMDTKKTVLEINPHVKQYSEDGSVTEMSEAEVITMTQTNGRTSVTTGGGGQIVLDSGKPSEGTDNKKKNAPAEKIDEKSVRQIPSPSLQK
jgi:lipopolysaccharide assembly outer membrane protein LptD (OstA)